MPKSIVPQPDKTLYPKRTGDVALNKYPGDHAIEGYFSNTILLTHNTEGNSPEIYMTVKRTEDRPNLNNDGSILILSSGRKIDDEMEYAVQGTSNFIPNTGNSKVFGADSDQIRLNSKKQTFLSAGENITISSNKKIIIEAQGDIEIHSNGKIKLFSNQIELGNGQLKRLVTEEIIQYFSQHVHPTSNGPSGPPVQPLPLTILTQKVKAL